VNPEIGSAVGELLQAYITTTRRLKLTLPINWDQFVCRIPKPTLCLWTKFETSSDSKTRSRNALIAQDTSTRKLDPIGLRITNWWDLIRFTTCPDSSICGPKRNEISILKGKNTRVTAIGVARGSNEARELEGNCRRHKRSVGLTVCRLCSWACRGRKSSPWPRPLPASSSPLRCPDSHACWFEQLSWHSCLPLDEDGELAVRRDSRSVNPTSQLDGPLAPAQD